MKIGIVGPMKWIIVIEKCLKEYYQNVKTTRIELATLEQVPNIIQYLHVQESYFDGIIFSGKIPYDIINHAMHSKNAWIYIERNHHHLQRVLLEIALNKQYDPLNISLDCYDEKTLLKSFDEINISKDKLRYFLEIANIYKPTFIEDLKQFHRNNFYQNKVSVCITEITSIYEDLTSEGIPCFLSAPTKNDIKNTIKQLEMKMRSRVNEQSQIVVLAIEIDLPNEYSMIYENEYQIMSEKTKVTDKVYLFAQRIQATVIEIGTRGYLLFSTKNILEFETKNLEYISLLENIASYTTNTISMGIGYGITAREANYNANLGMHKSKKSSGNICYAVNDGKFIGPITSAPPSKENEIIKIDEKYLKISELTGVSIDTIFRIQCFIDQHKNEYCTPIELAEFLEISKRSVNRILEKLGDAGYMKIVGKKSQIGAGRPSRIVKISFRM